MSRRRPTPLQQWAQDQLEILEQELKFLQRHHRGWDRAWEVIKERYGDFNCQCPDTGEAWQYMGTAFGSHEFRHRCLPPIGERTYDKIPVEPGDWDVVREPSEKSVGPTISITPIATQDNRPRRLRKRL